jgi:hypothetical protein
MTIMQTTVNIQQAEKVSMWLLYWGKERERQGVREERDYNERSGEELQKQLEKESTKYLRV